MLLVIVGIKGSERWVHGCDLLGSSSAPCSTHWSICAYFEGTTKLRMNAAEKFDCFLDCRDIHCFRENACPGPAVFPRTPLPFQCLLLDNKSRFFNFSFPKPVSHVVPWGVVHGECTCNYVLGGAC